MNLIPNTPRITPELVAEHGLKPEEYDHFVKLIGREPTITELGGSDGLPMFRSLLEALA